jgi:mannose-6-phosphate isomerase-like protein (cupin superfamily)
MTDVGGWEGVERFSYRKPASGGSGVVGLGTSDVLTVEVQVFASGTSASYEADASAESVWFVIAGQARFADGAGAAFGEFGVSGGVYVPRSVAYRFEAIGADDLEILRIAAVDPRGDGQAADGPATMQAISYDDPEFDEGSDITVPRLWPGGDMLTVTVEKVRDGEGDDPPHAHFGIEGAWFMLGGRVRFHGMTDASAYEMTTHDAVYLPSGTAYGFRALDHEPAHVLHVKSLDLGVDEHKRVDF